MGRGGSDRREALHGAFSWRAQASPPARILLVDDVLTTGSTLVAAGAALRQAGAKEVLAVALALG